MEFLEFVDKYKNRVLNVTLIVIAAFIAYNVIFKKQSAEIKAIKANKEIELKKSEALESISGSERMVNLYKKLLTKRDATTVINQVTTLARQAGIKVISVRPESEQKFGEYVKLPINLTVHTTDYHALGKFVSSVENQQDVYMVENAKIVSGENTKELVVELRIVSVIFTG